MLTLAGLTLMAGCGGNPFGPLGAISGKLTLDGEAAPTGTKVLYMGPETGHAGYSITKDGGQYDIEWRHSGKTYKGLPVGKYQVMIVSHEADDSDSRSAEEMLAGDKPKASAKPKAKIPPKYSRGNTSGLEYTIQEGPNTIDINIEL